MVPVFAARGPGSLLLAALMVAVAALADTVDGALAIITDRTSRLGYVYDSVVDRLGELIWLVAFWLIGVPAYAVVIAGTLTWMHEYVRSRANAAGMTEIGGSTLGERPTRVVLSIVGFGLAGLVSFGNPDLGPGVATVAVGAWIVLSLIGFLQLFATIHRVLGGRKWPPWSVAGRTERAAETGGQRPADRPTRAASSRDSGPGYAHGSGCSRDAAFSPAVGFAGDPAGGLSGRPVPEPSAEAFAAIEAEIDAVGHDGRSGSRPASPGDDELRREIAELGELPGSSVIYTSTGTGDEDRHGRHELLDSGEPEGSPT
jgi:CDP-diacylglycerol--glycerol-3-phosphate 3-phosphatidyltransferase